MMKLWAHRGCSQLYPENTLLSFEKAAGVKGLTGIELDIQLTKDEEIVVIHDDRVDRTTEGIGYVRDFTLSQIKKLHIYADDNPVQQIPTMEEVLDCIGSGLRNGLLLNIETKFGVFGRSRLEEKIVDLINKRGFQDVVIYSSFYANSLQRLRELDEKVELGILDGNVSDCLWKLKGGCGANALHPYWQSIDMSREELKEYTVRGWFGGHLYPEKPTGTKLDLDLLESKGITDVIINEPEVYLR